MNLDQVIMRINADAELQFLHLAALVMLVSFLLMLLLNVLVFAVIDNFAHRRISARSDFNQVKPALFGKAQGMSRGEHAQLLIGDTIHHTHFGYADAFVDARLIGIPIGSAIVAP